MASIRIGCSGWNYRSWAGDFYPRGCPQRCWLEHYARHFDTVEVNTTFYRLPNRDAVARWVQQTPPGFLFTVKASRYLTHMKRLTDMGQGVERLWERLEPLTSSPKCGPILWQLPPNFRRDDARLRAALAQLPPGQHHAFELRHPSWFQDGAPTLDLLREHGVALAIGDRPEVHAFQPLAVTADFTLVRFHHGTRGRRGNYSETEIAAWAERIAEWARGGTAVFAYFNNDWEGFAPRNAARLQQLLQRMETSDLPPTRKSTRQAPSTPRQALERAESRPSLKRRRVSPITRETWRARSIASPRGCAPRRTRSARWRAGSAACCG